MRLAVRVLLFSLLSVSAFAGIEPIPDRDAVAKANNAFTLDLYRRLADTDGSIIASPFSVSTALAMLHAGARGETAKQMEKVLRFPFGGQRLDDAYSALLAATNGGGAKRPYDLTTANALWVQKGVALRRPYVETVRKKFGAAIENVDFRGNPARAADRINSWVSDATRKMIPTIVSPGVLPPETRMVLTNAIYLKATWLEPFEPKLTKDAPFHVSKSRRVPVKTMANQYEARRASVPGGRMLELPYAGNDLVMWLVVPDAVDGLAGIEKKLTADALQQWERALQLKEVSVCLPKFESSMSVTLSRELSAMGMKLPFANSAGFSGVAEEPLAVSEVVHKGRIIVDEIGTEAAAATGLVMVTSTRMPEPPEIFRFDRPFLYMIRSRSSGAILFIGRFAGPD